MDVAGRDADGVPSSFSKSRPGYRVRIVPIAARGDSAPALSPSPIVAVGGEPVEVAPATERVMRPSTKMKAATSVMPSISVDAPAPTPPTRAQMTELLGALGASHAKLDLDLAYLEKLASAVFDRDAVSRAAAETVMLRALEVAELKSALGRVALAVDEPEVEALLAPGTTLSSFVRLLYLWADKIASALIDFAASALRGNPAWSIYEMRITEMSQFQMHALTEQIRHEAGTYGIFSEFGETLDELFWAAWYLHESMSKGGAV
jgi:hypothetical protein